MSLIKCPECNGDISDSAKVCPHCGAKTKKAKEKTELICWIFILIILAIGAIIFFMNYQQKKERELLSSNNVSTEYIESHPRVVLF